MNNLKKTLVLLLLAGITVFSFAAFKKQSHPPDRMRVVGYLFRKKIDMSKIPYKYLTHINYSFALPAPGGTGEILPVPLPGKLKELVTNAHAHGVKVFISIGGWEIGDGGGNDNRFETLANSAVSRTKFARNTMNIIRKFNLDGADIDWEYPNPIEPSASNYVLLMKELSDSLHASGKKLTAAIVSFQDRYGYGIKKEVFSYVDWMNIMAYDYENGKNMSHSPYYLAVRSLEYWVKDRGLPKEKAVLGLNFGFYKFLIRHGADPYADSYITDVSKWGFRRSGDGNKPKIDTLYYNGITTVKAKTKLAMEEGGGIMMWAVSGDTTGRYSLLKAINETADSK